MGCFVQTHRNKAKKTNRNLFPFHLFFRSLIFLSNQKLPVLSRRAHTHTHTPEECVFTWICSGVHWSRLTDLTLEMWTPRFRWIPAQRIHMNTPRFQEAQRGPETAETGKALAPLEVASETREEEQLSNRRRRRVCRTELRRVQAL